MRDDIVGMLKNAIDHGGNPQKIAQSLINSGYSMKDVKEAYDYVMSSNPELKAQQAQQVNQQTPQMMISSQPQQSPQQQTQTKVQQQYSKPQNLQVQQKPQMPQAPQYKAPSPPQQAQFSKPKPLPSQKINPSGVGKILVLILVLLLLVLALVSVIVFKEEILDLLSL